MKTTCWFVLLLGTAGCVTLPPLWPEWKKNPPVSTETAKPATPAAPVTADQVTESNARQKANALQDELDREERGRMNPR